jgi:hypothetical protein
MTILSASARNWSRNLPVIARLIFYVLVGVALVFIIWPARAMAFGLQKLGVLIGKVGAHYGRSTTN